MQIISYRNQFDKAVYYVIPTTLCSRNSQKDNTKEIVRKISGYPMKGEDLNEKNMKHF